MIGPIFGFAALYMVGSSGLLNNRLDVVAMLALLLMFLAWILSLWNLVRYDQSQSKVDPILNMKYLLPLILALVSVVAVYPLTYILS